MEKKYTKLTILIFFICIQFTYSQDIYQTFSICSGQEVFFQAPELVSGPCVPIVNEIIRKQTGESLDGDESGFLFKPEAGLHVIVTKGSCVYTTMENDFTSIYRTESERTYEVIVDRDCPIDDDPIFTEFPWLQNLVGPNNCSEETIEIYQSGIFNYLLINRRSFDRKLYFQDGTEYCRSTANFDCVSLYGLGEPIDTWICGENIEPINEDCLVTITNTQCREIGVYDEDGTFLTLMPANFGGVPNPDVAAPVWTDTRPLSQNVNRTYIFKVLDLTVGGIIVSCDGANITTNSTFNNSCTDALGLQTFTNSGCRSITVSNIYGGGFTLDPDETKEIAQSIPTQIWIVTAESDTLYIIDSRPGPTVIGTGGCEEESSDQVFFDFPWLSSIISPDCTEGSVSVYESGIFNFLFVRTQGDGKLYFEDGTFYCQNSENFDCISAYQLGSPVSFYECFMPITDCEVTISNTQCKPMGIFDVAGNLLTTMTAASLGEVPEQIIPEWNDPNPLDIGESRTYIIKDGLLTVATKTVTCDNPGITTINPFAPSCNDALTDGIFINTGCRTLDIFDTNGNLLHVLDPVSINPEAAYGPVVITNEIFVFVAEGDTIAIKSEQDGDINSGGCLRNIMPNSIPDNFTDYDVIYTICTGDSLIIDTPQRYYQCQLPPECFTQPIICENFPLLQELTWFTDDGDLNSVPASGFTRSVFSPSETTSYIASFAPARCGFGPAGPLTSYSYLVVVDESVECTKSPYTTFNIDACFGDTITIPIPDHEERCTGTFTNSQVFDVLEINANYARVVVLNEGEVFYEQESDFQEYIQLGFQSNGASCPKVTYLYNIQIKAECIFESYTWLSDLVDASMCTNEIVEVFESGIFKFILVTDGSGQKTLYNQDGLFYCQNSNGFDCVEAYNFAAPILTWSCAENPGESCQNTGTVFLLPCGNGQFFYFIETESGELLDLYIDSSISFQALDGQKVNFDFIDAGFSSPCSIADKAITATCIEPTDDNPVANGNCNNYKAEIISRQCDNGSNYFFLLTDAGEILDAYLADGIDYTLVVGQQVNVDFEIAHFESPCSIADDAIIITCITDDDMNSNNLIFDEYPFLLNVVDPNNCDGISIEVYDQGTYAFLFIRTAANTGSLYLSDGSLYCTNSASNNCTALYGLNNPTDIWACENLLDNISLDHLATDSGESMFQVYPNPTTSIASIQLPILQDEFVTLQVMSTDGKTIQSIDLSKTTSGQVLKIDLSHTRAGIYYIQLVSTTERFIKKIIKQ